MRIRLADIKAASSRVRAKTDDQSIEELAKSISEQGLLVPIKVRPTSDGYELIYGHRRVEAMRQLGWLETDAIVEGLDDASALLQQIIENEVREDVPYREKAEGYELALTVAGCSIGELAKRTGISRTRISDAIHWLEEDRAGAAVVVDEGEGLGPKDAGVVRTLEIRRALKDDVEAKRAVAEKVAREGLGRFKARELAEAVASEKDPQKRNQILERPFVPGTFGGAKSTFVSKPFHTAERSIADQFHSKIVWNLTRMDLTHYAHFTVGYSQRSWEQLLELLKLANVTTLIDVRRNPVSQYRPEFSKGNLQTMCQNGGIGYRHIPTLGIESSERADLTETHDYSSLFDSYESRLTDELLKQLLGSSLTTERLAFLCVELDPNTCHRNRLARVLEKIGFSTFDL